MRLILREYIGYFWKVFFFVVLDISWIAFIESFGRILLNSEFICVIDIVSSYLGNWGKRVNFGNSVAEIQQKYERERQKVGERKFWISVITLTKFLLPKPANRVGVKCPKGNQLWQCHCRNMGKKIFVAMPLAKMGGKKINGCRNLGRK